MAEFTPSSIIYIGKVPFDNSYKHVMTFDSAQSQENYFASVCDVRYGRSDYTYQRLSKAIRVEVNAEKLYTYNYVMFKNANYGEKWFYAFIVACNYLNDKTTELIIEIDIMQTWFFDYQLTAGFVEREHVIDDTIGAHIKDEHVDLGEHIYKQQSVFDSLKRLAIIVQTTMTVTTKGVMVDKPNTHECSGGMYNGIYSGASYIVFNDDEAGHTELAQFLKLMNSAGCADAISSIFMYPAIMLQELDDPPFDFDPNLDTIYGKHVKVGEIAAEIGYGIPKQIRGALDGYTPKNNKLYCYPYNFIRVVDFIGGFKDYRYEFFTDDICHFNITAPICPDANAFCQPVYYNGVPTNVSEQFMISGFPKCAWTYKNYENWLAQNLATIGMGVGGGIVSMATGNPIAGGGALIGTLGTLYQQSKIPDQLVGSASSSAVTGIGYNTFGFQELTVRREFAEMIDSFFTCYGYEVDVTKVPNRTGRPYWNYVKMKNANMRGNVPASDMADINNVYNSGLTFWHTPDIGNYSLDNSN